MATAGSDALVDAVDCPLYVVTAGVGDEMSGCLAGFVTQCSIEPLRFLVCVAKVNHTYGIAVRCRGLAVHLLGADQYKLASLFGEESGDWANKFDQVDWSRGGTGVPVLTECAAWVEGPVLARMDAGDHDAFLVEVNAGAKGTHGGSFMLSAAAGIHPGHPLSRRKVPPQFYVGEKG